MTPAEHRAAAERLLSILSTADALTATQVQGITLQAVAYATLALAPAPAPLPPSKPKPAQRVEVFDVELRHLVVTTTGTSGAGAVILHHPPSDWSTLLDDPSQVRLLADTLTAHADRMENR